MSSYSHGKIIARRSSGIANLADLEGKRIGMVMGTTGEFYAIYSLLSEKINRDEVTFVDLPFKSLINSLKNADVDALSVWEPYGIKAEQSLGEDAVVFVNDNVLRHTFNLVSRPELLDDELNLEKFKRLLKATQKGADFIQQHPDQAAKILTQFLKISEEEIAQLLPQYDVGLWLDQLLILTLEAEGKWMLEQNSENRPDLPNYIHYLDSRLLKEVQPNQVHLID